MLFDGKTMRYLSLSCLFLCLHCVAIDAEEHNRLLENLSDESVPSTEDSSVPVEDTAISSDDSGEQNEDTGTPEEPQDSATSETAEPTPVESESTHSVYLSGEEQYLFLEPTTLHILDWHQNWSFSVYIPTNKGKGVLIANGANWIGFTKSGGETVIWLSGFDFPTMSETFPGTIRNKRRLTLTYSASNRTIRVYVEDELVVYKENLQVGSPPPNGNYPFVIGAYENNHIPTYWEGSLDQAVFLNRVMTPEEIIEICNIESIAALSFYDDIKAWWPLGEDTFPEISDKNIFFIV